MFLEGLCYIFVQGVFHEVVMCLLDGWLIGSFQLAGWFVCLLVAFGLIAHESP